MLVNGKEISVKEAVELSGVESTFMHRRSNGMLLSDYQIDVLERNNINYKKYNNMSSLLFEIEEYLNEEENDELEEVSRQIAEIHYYSETNK